MTLTATAAAPAAPARTGTRYRRHPRRGGGSRGRTRCCPRRVGSLSGKPVEHALGIGELLRQTRSASACAGWACCSARPNRCPLADRGRQDLFGGGVPSPAAVHRPAERWHRSCTAMIAEPGGGRKGPARCAGMRRWFAAAAGASTARPALRCRRGPDRCATLRAGSGGDGTALELLLERYLPQLHAFVRVRLGGVRARESSMDVVQSLCRDLLAGRERFEFRGEGPVPRLAVHSALNKLSAKHRFHAWRSATSAGAGARRRSAAAARRGAADAERRCDRQGDRQGAAGGVGRAVARARGLTLARHRPAAGMRDRRVDRP